MIAMVLFPAWSCVVVARHRPSYVTVFCLYIYMRSNGVMDGAVWVGPQRLAALIACLGSVVLGSLWTLCRGCMYDMRRFHRALWPPAF